MGNMVLAASKFIERRHTSHLLPIILIVVLFMLVYMTMSRRSRADEGPADAERRGARDTDPDHERDVPGTVLHGGPDDVVVEVAPGVNIRMMRRAVVPGPDGRRDRRYRGPRGQRLRAVWRARLRAAAMRSPGTDDRDPQDRNV